MLGSMSVFVDAMCAMGLSIRDTVIPDGKLHRFRVEGDKAGSKNGWYILYNDGLPAGAFGCWKRGITQNWCAKAENTLNAKERKEFRLRMEAARKNREAEDRARRYAASEKAHMIWKDSPFAPDNHPYLIKKGVRNYGLRLSKDALVVPLRDNAGMLHSLQFIDGEGNKRFLSGGRKKGCYFLMGNPLESLCIAEGYATAASIYDDTGIATAVAFDAGNLMSVTLALRAKFPKIKITLCADNDVNTPGNPGLTRAREAASACGALLAVPPIAGDFNDLIRQGL